MKKVLFSIFIAIGLAACDGKIESPEELLKITTLVDTHDYCIKVNGNRKYCKCEIEELAKTFPWDKYMAAVDSYAGEYNHVAAVIAKHNGSRKKVLEELNCKGCAFETALVVIDVSPSPNCEKFLSDDGQ